MGIIKHIIGYSATIVTGIIIGAAGASSPAETVAAPAVTTTVAAPVPPAETVKVPGPTVTVTAPVKAADSDTSLTKAALQMTWDNMPSAERKQICEGWNMGGAGQDYLLDVFMESAGGDFDRRAVKAFFDGKC